MKIDKRLNLVSVYDTASGPVHVHAAPVSRLVFETYYQPIAKAWASIFSKGLLVHSGPRVASLLLRDAATELGVWDTPGGVKQGLVAELRRLTNVVMATDRGWRTRPLQDVIDGRLMDEDDLAEVENDVTFFICASAMARRSELPQLMSVVTRLSGTACTSLNVTEYVALLPTSTAAETTQAPTSSLPT